MNTELIKHVESFDNGEEVKTVIMGGITNGYEVAIQELAIEIMRTLALIKVPKEDEGVSLTVSVACDEAVDLLDKKYGFSGAQVGAAKNIATIYWRKTPSVALAQMESIDNNRIITIKNTPNGIMLSRDVSHE